MKTQEVLNYVRNEWENAWHGLTDQWNNFRQRANHALVAFKPETKRPESHGNGKFNEWGLLAADMYDVGDRLVVRLEVPGLRPDALQVAVDGNELVIRGEKSWQTAETDEIQQYFFSEIAYGTFERRITLPKRKVADSDNGASYEQGVLTIEMPFSEEPSSPPRTISVH